MNNKVVGKKCYVIPNMAKYKNGTFSFVLTNTSDQPQRVQLFGSLEDFQKAIQGGQPVPEPSELVTKIEHDDLLALAQAGELVPGMLYQITDYDLEIESTTRYKSGHHLFDIVVRAISATDLAKDAKAAYHEGDEYFSNSDLSAWKILYEIDNTKDEMSTYSPVSDEGTKGYIYYLEDEFGNSARFDFKNLQFAKSEIYKGADVLPADVDFFYMIDYRGADASVIDNDYYMRRNIKCWSDPYRAPVFECADSNAVFIDVDIDYETKKCIFYANSLTKVSVGYGASNVAFIDDPDHRTNYGSFALCHVGNQASDITLLATAVKVSVSNVQIGTDNDHVIVIGSRNVWIEDQYQNYGYQNNINIGEGGDNIHIGAGCKNIKIGEYASLINIGSGCADIDLKTNREVGTALKYMKNINVGDGCEKIEFISSETQAANNTLQNIVVVPGTKSIVSEAILSVEVQRLLTVCMYCGLNSTGELTKKDLFTVIE